MVGTEELPILPHLMGNVPLNSEDGHPGPTQEGRPLVRTAQQAETMGCSKKEGRTRGGIESR